MPATGRHVVAERLLATVFADAPDLFVAAEWVPLVFDRTCRRDGPFRAVQWAVAGRETAGFVSLDVSRWPDA